MRALSGSFDKKTSLETLHALVETKFNSLTVDVERRHSDTVQLLRNLTEQVASLETQVQHRPVVSARDASGRKRVSSRVNSREPTQLEPAKYPSQAMNGHVELVPLLTGGECKNTEPLAAPTQQGRSWSKESCRSVRSQRHLAVPSKERPQSQFQADVIASLDQEMGGLSFQEKLKIAQHAMEAGKGKQSHTVKLVTAFLEDPETSDMAKLYSQFMLAFLVFAIMVGLLPYVGMDQEVFCSQQMSVAIDSVLFAEILVRCLFCPNFKAFCLNIENLVDSLSGVPLMVVLLMANGAFENGEGQLFLVAAVPVIRLLRLVRRFPTFKILITAFSDSLEALPVLLYTMAVMACAFTSLLYLVEPRDNIRTLPESAWFVLATVTTTGYGDITPATKLGEALASVLMVVSPLYMAMPFGIIGYNFTVIWGNRAQILLLNGTRDRLRKWGFGAYEIPHLFELFDLDESAEIDLQEFLLLLKEMEIGFREDDVIELFKVIDKDSGGTIDEREFVKTLYPVEYRYMFGKKKVKDSDYIEEGPNPNG